MYLRRSPFFLLLIYLFANLKLAYILEHVNRNFAVYLKIWKRAGVVERAALEMRYIRKGIRGSNPLASANIFQLDYEKKKC